MTWPRMTLSVVRVLLARGGREFHLAVTNRIVDQLVIGERAKRLGELQLQEVVDCHVVDVAGRVGNQHPHCDLVGRQELRKPARDFVVQVDAPLLDQHQQKRRHKSFRDAPNAIVHVRCGRHGRHRGAQGHGQDLAVVHPHSNAPDRHWAGRRAGRVRSARPGCTPSDRGEANALYAV